MSCAPQVRPIGDKRVGAIARTLLARISAKGLECGEERSGQRSQQLLFLLPVILTYYSILDEFPRDGCHMCGMPRAEMAQHGHGEGVCNQRPIACPLCAKTFTLWSHYETHKKCHQKLKQRQYPCQSCGKVVKFIALSAILQICEILCSLYVVLRSSRLQATGTCTKGFTREFVRSSAFLVGSFSARRLICRSTNGRRDTSKPPSSTKSGRRRA